MYGAAPSPASCHTEPLHCPTSMLQEPFVHTQQMSRAVKQRLISKPHISCPRGRKLLACSRRLTCPRPICYGIPFCTRWTHHCCAGRTSSRHQGCASIHLTDSSRRDGAWPSYKTSLQPVQRIRNAMDVLQLMHRPKHEARLNRKRIQWTARSTVRGTKSAGARTRKRTRICVPLFPAHGLASPCITPSAYVALMHVSDVSFCPHFRRRSTGMHTAQIQSW